MLIAEALKLDPKNFLLASDVAQTYYGIRPPRVEAERERELAGQQRVVAQPCRARQRAWQPAAPPLLADARGELHRRVKPRDR